MRRPSARTILASVAVLTAATLTALLVVLVVTAIRSRSEALASLHEVVADQAAARATIARRIDRLQDTIADLEDEVSASAAEVARLRAQVAALQRQLEQAGEDPVVPRERSAPPDDGSEPSPDPEPEPSPSPPDPPPRPPGPPAPLCLPLTDLCL